MERPREEATTRNVWFAKVTKKQQARPKRREDNKTTCPKKENEKLKRGKE